MIINRDMRQRLSFAVGNTQIHYGRLSKELASSAPNGVSLQFSSNLLSSNDTPYFLS